jgi:hypothetical protein
MKSDGDDSIRWNGIMAEHDHITISLDGVGGEIDADAFLALLADTIGTLKQINAEVSEFGTANISWRIVGAGMSSPLFATLRGQQESMDETPYVGRVIGAFVDGVNSLETVDTCPKYFNKKSLRLTNEMARAFALGVRRIEFSVNGTTAAVTKKTAENAATAILKLEHEESRRAGRYIEYGTIEGHLSDLSELSGRDKLVIIDALTRYKTPCYFRAQGIEMTARYAWKKRVAVTGEITVDRSTGLPVEVRVEEITILRERDELPQIENLYGLNITGGIESSEYVRGLRDAE